MNAQDERAMHDVAQQLAMLTAPKGGWEASRYAAIAKLVKELTTYCAVCDCTAVSKK